MSLIIDLLGQLNCYVIGRNDLSKFIGAFRSVYCQSIVSQIVSSVYCLSVLVSLQRFSLTRDTI